LDKYHVALYIHFVSLLIGIGAASVLTVCAFQLRAARTLADAGPWGRVAAKVGRLFPIAILGLFGSGAYMTSDLWTWDTGWIEVGIAALVVLAIQGPVVAERSGKKVAQALMANGPGELRGDALRKTRYLPLWWAEMSAIGLVLAIIWNMTTKAGLGSSIAAAVGGYAVGVALALLLTRQPSTEAAPATEPTA
jgi:hypothetical protein